MGIRRASLAATLLVGCALPLAVPAATAVAAGTGSLCAPPADTVGPAITKVTFGKPKIDLDSGSRTQTIAVTASDASGNGAPSGVARIDTVIRGEDFYAHPKLKRTAGTPTAGTWTGSFVVSKYAHPGAYTIEFLSAVDADGNVQYYGSDATTPTGPNSLLLHPADNPSFTVTGTPAKRHYKKAGRLRAFSFGPSIVNTTSSAHRVHVTAKFAGAAPHRVSADFVSDKPVRHVRLTFLTTRLHDRHGTWTGSVTVPRWLGKQVMQAQLNADYGPSYHPSYRNYNSTRLHQLHFPTKLTIISGVDATRPKLTSLSFAPPSVDSTNGTVHVTITARATDKGSGVRSVSVSGGIRRGINGVTAGYYPRAAAGIGYLSEQSFDVRLRKDASGHWVGTATFKRCVPSGTYKLEASVGDVANNYRFYSTKLLAKAGLRSTLEVTSKHGDIEAPYVFSAATYGAESNLFLNFSEGVKNVSTSTLTVFPLSPASTRFTTTSTVTAIVCSNGVQSIDCSGADGLVTSAKLTVADMKPATKYQVYANLNQVVPQLTDGNRNPLDWNSPATEVVDA